MKKSIFASPSNTSLLANRYQLKQLIGKGGMGEVFLADDVLLGGIPVAIKFLSQSVSNEKMAEDFVREARICAALSQKSIHIVRVTDYGVSKEDKPFFVMEYLSGKSIKDLIPMSLPMFLSLCRQICLGLQCAHEGLDIDGKIYPLVHRDIKPANVLVVPDKTLGQLVKVLDFGIAKFLNYSSTIQTTNKGFHGTLPYSSPEQLDANQLDNRTDIYSFGVMMFEMLTGEKPWQPENNFFGTWYKAHHFEKPRAIVDVNPHLKVPKKLDDLIMACLAKTPSSRPQNLAEILKILDSLEVGGGGSLERKVGKIFNQNARLPPSINGESPAIAPKSVGDFKERQPQREPQNQSSFQVVEKACKKLEWPKEKPIQEIVFPHLLDTEQGSVAALSLMMSMKQINNCLFSTRYNQFIFVTSPHPMLLWVTLLYNRAQDPKWLPCYLDMQKPGNHKLIYLLAENERYPLIFYALEAPPSCIGVTSCHIDPTQRQMLKTWVKQSQSIPPCSNAELSKNLLKQQYKQLQSLILQRLASQGE